MILEHFQVSWKAKPRLTALYMPLITVWHPQSFHMTFSTAVAFPAHSWARFVSEHKVTPRVTDGRSGPAGRVERGKRRQRGCPTVTKVFRVRGRGSICSGLRGHCSAGRDLLPWCVLLVFSACGWIFISDFRTNKVYYSQFAWELTTHTHTHTQDDTHHY